MEHLGYTRHLRVVELLLCTLKHAFGCQAAKVIFKDELARQDGTLLGGVSTVDHHKEGMGVGRVPGDVQVLERITQLNINGGCTVSRLYRAGNFCWSWVNFWPFCGQNSTWLDIF